MEPWPLIVPISGLIALIAGVGIAIAKREANVLWVLVGLALSHGLMIFAPAMREFLRDNDPAIYGFLAVQFVVSGFVFVQMRKARGAGALVGWANLTYAYVAVIIVGLMFNAQF